MYFLMRHFVIFFKLKIDRIYVLKSQFTIKLHIFCLYKLNAFCGKYFMKSIISDEWMSFVKYYR